jgi:hypothetical protein
MRYFSMSLMNLMDVFHVERLTITFQSLNYAFVDSCVGLRPEIIRTLHRYLCARWSSEILTLLRFT